jgi:putative drug exporter of the RND superfamily
MSQGTARFCTVERLARFVLRHRLVVGLAWLAMFIAGGIAAGPATDRLTVDFSLPGQPGYEAEMDMVQAFGISPADALIPVLTVPEGQTVQQRSADVAKVFDTVRTQVPGIRVTDLGSTKDERFVTDGGRSTFALVEGPQPTGFDAGIEKDVRPVFERAAEQAGLEPGLTSYNLLSAGGETEGPSVLVETLFGALGALAVLLFVFASFLAFVPLLIAAVSILTTFLLVLLLTYVTDVSFVVQFLIALIGLGVAIDYSLLLVSRWREERAHGRSNDEAVVIAVKTAGHAVVASGVTVAVSLLALLVVPVPFLRSMGLGGMFIPLVSVAVVITLLPALLSKIGPRVDWPRIRHDAVAARGWSAWARLIVRRRWIAAVSAAVVLGIIIAPVFGIKIGAAGSDSLARSGPAYEALKVLQDGGVGDGVLTPIEVLAPDAQAQAVAEATRGVEGVRMAVTDGSANGLTLIHVFPAQGTVDSSSNEVTDAVRAAAEGASGDVRVTGTGATIQDYFRAVYDNFPYVLALIALITFVLLVRTFRSLILPIKAVLLNLVSLSAVFGAVVWFWQEGHGSDAIFNTSPTGAITFWLPVIIFAFLFGLSMDYEVFILARMREEYDRTGSTAQAVVTGLGRTGRLVTSAALILFFAFAALAASPGTDIKVIGTALGVGILIDATLVRALLVPALVSLFGRWNWWLPTGLAKVLRVEPSPVAPAGSEPGLAPQEPEQRKEPEPVSG